MKKYIWTIRTGETNSHGDNLGRTLNIVASDLLEAATKAVTLANKYQINKIEKSFEVDGE